LKGVVEEGKLGTHGGAFKEGGGVSDRDGKAEDEHSE